MNPKVNQHLRNSLALLMSEWSEEIVSARWHGDLKSTILGLDEFKCHYVEWFMPSGDMWTTYSKADDKQDMLIMAIYALHHILGDDMPDFEEYMKVEL